MDTPYLNILLDAKGVSLSRIHSWPNFSHGVLIATASRFSRNFLFFFFTQLSKKPTYLSNNSQIQWTPQKKTFV